MKIRRSGVYGAVGAGILFATTFLPMSAPRWCGTVLISSVAVFAGLALFFNSRERKAGQCGRSLGFFVLAVLVIIFALLAIVPMILW